MLTQITRDDYAWPVRDLDYTNMFFRVDGSCSQVYLHVQEGEDKVCCMHTYVEGNNVNAIRQMRIDKPAFFSILRDRGISYVLGIRNATDDIGKWHRFIHLAVGTFQHKIHSRDGVEYAVVRVEVN